MTINRPRVFVLFAGLVGNTWTWAVGRSGAGAEVAAEPVGAGSVVQVVLSLGLIILLIFGAAWLLKRFGHWSPVNNANLRVVGGVSLGQRERLILVQVGEKQLLLGVAPGSVRMLHVLEEAPSDRGDHFSSHLKQAGEGEPRK